MTNPFNEKECWPVPDLEQILPLDEICELPCDLAQVPNVPISPDNPFMSLPAIGPKQDLRNVRITASVPPQGVIVCLHTALKHPGDWDQDNIYYADIYLPNGQEFTQDGGYPIGAIVTNVNEDSDDPCLQLPYECYEGMITFVGNPDDEGNNPYLVDIAVNVERASDWPTGILEITDNSESLPGGVYKGKLITDWESSSNFDFEESSTADPVSVPGPDDCEEVWIINLYEHMRLSHWIPIGFKLMGYEVGRTPASEDHPNGERVFVTHFQRQTWAGRVYRVKPGAGDQTLYEVRQYIWDETANSTREWNPNKDGDPYDFYEARCIDRVKTYGYRGRPNIPQNTPIMVTEYWYLNADNVLAAHRVFTVTQGYWDLGLINEVLPDEDYTILDGSSRFGVKYWQYSTIDNEDQIYDAESHPPDSLCHTIQAYQRAIITDSNGNLVEIFEEVEQPTWAVNLREPGYCLAVNVEKNETTAPELSLCEVTMDQYTWVNAKTVGPEEILIATGPFTSEREREPGVPYAAASASIAIGYINVDVNDNCSFSLLEAYKERPMGVTEEITLLNGAELGETSLTFTTRRLVFANGRLVGSCDDDPIEIPVEDCPEEGT